MNFENYLTCLYAEVDPVWRRMKMMLEEKMRKIRERGEE
jgi:hypothetical protein